LTRPARPAQPGALEALRDSQVGPIELDTVRGPKGRYPLDHPFAWGSVHLARELNGVRFSSSTLGGIYSAGPRCVEIATSEGAERLAVRGARPDLFKRGVPLHPIYSRATQADERARRPCCHALDLIGDRPSLVPFESVAVGLPRAAFPRALYREPFYTGAASHRTLREAALHATLELLGRDAFMIAWYRRRALPALSWPRKSSALAAGRARFLERRGMKLELFDLRLDVPLPMLLLRVTARRGRGNWPSGGALLVPSAGFAPMQSLEHALGLACGQFISIALQPAAFKNPLDAKAVRSLGRRLHFWPALARYLEPKNSHAHAFLGSSLAPFESLPRVSPDLKTLRSLLDRAELPWLAVRLTDAPAERAGFETVKVIIPGLINCAKSRAEVDFGLPRLHRDWPLGRAGLNPQPHPLY
jgi:thiazole/oxazole-forming peptide maturase SagD family component